MSRGFLVLACLFAACGHDIETTGRIGDQCLVAHDCSEVPQEAAVCFTAAPNGYCSRVCDPADVDPCGPGAKCLLLANSDSVCLKSCATNADCAESLECRKPAGSGDIPLLCVFEAFDADFR
jgi:hypothetical protein